MDDIEPTPSHFIAWDIIGRPLNGKYQVWEEVLDEDIFEDGELKLDSEQVKNKIYQRLMYDGDWVLIRKENS